MIKRILILSTVYILIHGFYCFCGGETQRRFQDRINYERVDHHALNAPSSAATSVEKLAEYLIKPYFNDWEKTRVIYRWITENISYDSEFDQRIERTIFMLNHGAFIESDREIMEQIGSPDDVLSQGKSVCGGYSNLFEALANRTGLESVTINGYSKGAGYDLCSEFSGESNHAWNAVKLDGDWYLVDCTWGAGHVDQRGKYIQEFDEHYFLTPPEEFIYDHFPVDQDWQLLDDPIDLAEYEDMPLLKSAFFKYGLELGSHSQCLIESNGDLRISIYAPAEVIMIADLIYENTNLPDEHTLVQKSGDTCQINTHFPHGGEYILRIYAATSGNPDNRYNWVMDYKALVENMGQSYVEFPKCYQSFYDMNAYLISPLEGTLITGRHYDFAIKLPGADMVEVEFGGTSLLLEKDLSNPDIFTGQISIPQNSRGKLEIRTPHPDKKFWYQVLLEYQLAN